MPIATALSAAAIRPPVPRPFVSTCAAPRKGGPLTTDVLYADHCEFVLRLLPTFGVFGPDQEDVAQTVWQSIHTQIATYDPARQSPRAWITGFVRRCASNYRRGRRRRPESAVAEPDVEMALAAPGLSPEQWAMLRTIEQAIRDEDQREAFLLKVRHGLTLEEIATVAGVSTWRIEWRLQRAGECLRI
jgi:RNA polymerase sigma factor (sigma-70 family)